ncbi:hypothetical protein GXW82_01560 [Streptacidiphilus sp. 4-A2]|nr:hypothetical protein [Streptacidiphilus sp. 4-A2]
MESDDQLSTAIAVFRDAPTLKQDDRSRSLAGVAGQKEITGDGLPSQVLLTYLGYGAWESAPAAR